MPARGNTEPNVKSTALALTAEARAKVNLTLRVVGRRVDGYHDLESVVAFADCADRLSLTPGPQVQLSPTVPLEGAGWPKEGAWVEAGLASRPASTNNLKGRAMRIQLVTSEVLAALNATSGAWLARMSGSGATCFAIFENTAEAQRASQM